MSAAASKLVIESPTREESSFIDDEPIPESERRSLERLAQISPPTSSGPIIAVDLDDVLSETNHAIAEWHNEVYGTDMTVSSFYYYYYWKNPYWGSIRETFEKVTAFYATDRLYQANPVPGAREGVQTLRDMGYRLIIVTARAQEVHEKSWKWVNYHFPGIFDSVICTGQFKDAHKNPGHEVITKLSKAQVCADLGAQLLIDDSSENALQVINAKAPTRVLLFGDYPWNQRTCSKDNSHDGTVFETRLKAEGGREFWKDETVEIPEGAPLWRIKNWAEAVRWVKRAKSEGKI